MKLYIYLYYYNCNNKFTGEYNNYFDDKLKCIPYLFENLNILIQNSILESKTNINYKIFNNISILYNYTKEIEDRIKRTSSITANNNRVFMPNLTVNISVNHMNLVMFTKKKFDNADFNDVIPLSKHIKLNNKYNYYNNIYNNVYLIINISDLNYVHDKTTWFYKLSIAQILKYVQIKNKERTPFKFEFNDLNNNTVGILKIKYNKSVFEKRYSDSY